MPNKSTKAPITAPSQRTDNPLHPKAGAKRGDERQAVILSPENVECLLKACEQEAMLKLFVLGNPEAGADSARRTTLLRLDNFALDVSLLDPASERGCFGGRTG